MKYISEQYCILINTNDNNSNIIKGHEIGARIYKICYIKKGIYNPHKFVK